jgi:hypothetical protein
VLFCTAGLVPGHSEEKRREEKRREEKRREEIGNRIYWTL